MKSDKIVVFMTCENEAEARKIARELLEKKKAACVSIFPRGDSYFWWRGKIDSAREFLLIAKTRKSLLKELVELVRKMHSYEVPEVVALPVAGGSEDYLEWLDEVLA